MGISSELVPLWQRSAITILLSRGILEEYLRVLSYPKFQLSEVEIKSLTEEELLPYVEVVNPRRRLRVVERDPSDKKFLNALSPERHGSSSPEIRTCCPSAVTAQSASNRRPSFSP